MTAPGAERRRRLGLVQWFGLSIGVLVLVAVLGLVGGLLSLANLADERDLVADRLDPATVTAEQLSTALVDQESGVRGYVLSRDETFLEPYTRGRRVEEPAIEQLLSRTRRAAPELGGDVRAVRSEAGAWRLQYAESVIADVRRGRRVFTPADQARGKVLFDRVRSALTQLTGDLRVQRASARRRLDHAAKAVTAIFIVFGIVLLISVAAAAVLLRRVAVVPIARLAASVRAVSRGGFDRQVEVDGAREVVELGEDVEAMRARIVEELDQLEATRAELQRSNTELEQFAYVASHDLQEPLRKVASFSQMLQKRYAGQLDERADRYIEFAVDGAVRMQELINDLLAFSRVGRLTEPAVVVDANELVDRAVAGLSGVIEETGATVEVGELPQLRGEAPLLALVFQNLIANGLKFRGDDPPCITVGAEREGDHWLFTVADNGIGIEPEYADRIFIIFQRLHPRTVYDGTGIGLSMCRKVIEYHGGRIWLDTERTGGATFHFTLPAIEPADRGDSRT